MKLTKILKIKSRLITPEQNNSVLKNELVSSTCKTAEKRISLKKVIVLNCFYIMERYLASNYSVENENFPRFCKTNHSSFSSLPTSGGELERGASVYSVLANVL
jgi:hypothetical protein